MHRNVHLSLTLFVAVLSAHVAACSTSTQVDDAQAPAVQQSAQSAVVLEPVPSKAFFEIATQRTDVLGAIRIRDKALLHSDGGHQYQVETDVGATSGNGLRNFLQSAVKVSLGRTNYGAVFLDAISGKVGPTLTVSDTNLGGRVEPLRSEVDWYNSLFQTLRGAKRLLIADDDLAVVRSDIGTFQYPDARVVLALRPGSPESYAKWAQLEGERIRMPFIPLPRPAHDSNGTDWGGFQRGLRQRVDTLYETLGYGRGAAEGPADAPRRPGIDVVAIDLARVNVHEAEIIDPMSRGASPKLPKPLRNVPVLFLETLVKPPTLQTVSHGVDIPNADRSSMIRLFKLTPLRD